MPVVYGAASDFVVGKGIVVRKHVEALMRDDIPMPVEQSAPI